MNPIVKQYLMVAAVIAVVISILINFVIVDFLKSSFFSGFPIGLTGTSGLGEFLARVFNTAFFTLFLTYPIYLGLRWIEKR
jgi:hypothetical protein